MSGPEMSIKRQRSESDFTHVELSDVTESCFQLVGSGKFLTPRCRDMSVPILVISDVVVGSVESLERGDSKVSAVILCTVEETRAQGFLRWLRDIDADRECKVLVDDEKLALKVRIMANDNVMLFDRHASRIADVDGALRSLQGITMSCALELPCVWFSDDVYGITINLLEAHLSTDIRPPTCLISDECSVEDHPLSLMIEPSYVPFDG